MKNFINKSCVVFFLVLGSFITSQAQISPSLLDKKWKVVFDEYRHVRYMSEPEWESFKLLPDYKRRNVLENMKAEAEKAVFMFGADFSFEVTLSGETVEQGRWELKPDGRTIIARNEVGYEDRITLIDVSSDRLILSSEQYGQEVVLVPYY